MYASALDTSPSKPNKSTSFLLNNDSLVDYGAAMTHSLTSFVNDQDDDSLVFDNTDVECLKKNILFKYMNAEKLYALVREKILFKKKKKYKEVVDKGYECQDNIYIIKSGEMNVWIKMTRDNIKTYDEKIDKYHVKNLDDYSHINQQRARYRRTALINLISSRNALNNDRPSYISCTSASDLTGSCTNSRQTPRTSGTSPYNLNTQHSRVMTSTTVRSAGSGRLKANTQSNLSPRLIVAQHRPVTTRVTKNSKENLNTIPYKGTLARFTGVSKRNNNETNTSLSNLPNDERFSKKFDLNLKTIERLNSARTEQTEKSVKTETCTEMSDDTINDFDLKDCEELKSKSAFMSRPKTGHFRQDTARKQLRISDNNPVNQKVEMSCYIKLMKLNPNEIFGLSELIFNNNKNIYKENLTIENNRVKGHNLSETESDRDLNSRNMNSYSMVCSSRQVEYYVINKSLFLKNMNDTEKFFFQSQIENMQKKCQQIPNNEAISGNFNEKQKWNNYKKKVYNEALKSRSSSKFSNNSYSTKTPAFNTYTDRPKTSYCSEYTGANTRSYNSYSNIDLIRNSRVHVKNGLNDMNNQNPTFRLSSAIVAQKRNAVHEVHAGKNRFHF